MFKFSTFSLVALIFLLEMFNLELNAQELTAQVRVITENLGTSNKKEFNQLEKNLELLLNNTRWTQLKVGKSERIPCRFFLKIKEVKDQNKYSAELSITATRPVFNTSYETTIFVCRDKNLNFEWEQGSPIEYNIQNLDNNLTSSFAIYAYIIIAMTLDSYSNNASTSLREPMNQILNQTLSKPDWKGWDKFEQGSRANLVMTILDDKHQAFRELWYKYHRIGLDQCEAKLERGRIILLNCILDLSKYKNEFYSSFYIQLFENTKLTELVNLFSKAQPDSKDKILRVLEELYPTYQDLFSKLKR